MTKQPTCEERIAAELEDRLEDFDEILTRQDRAQAVGNDEKYEEATRRRDEYGLSLDSKLVVTFQISWGGPSDEFEAVVDPEDYSIERITYVFKDWFDGARRDLSGSQFDLAERFLQPLVEYEVNKQRESRERAW